MLRARRAVKQLQRRLRNDPDNHALRVKLAGALRDAGRTDEAIAMYREVAVGYRGQGRLSQAAAVCRSALELDPERREILDLLQELEAMRASQQEVEPTVVRDDRFSLPSLNPQAAARSGRRSSVPSRRSPPERQSPHRSSPRPSPAGRGRGSSRGPPSSPPQARPSPGASSAPRDSQVRPPGVPGPPGESPRPTPSPRPTRQHEIEPPTEAHRSDPSLPNARRAPAGPGAAGGGRGPGGGAYGTSGAAPPATGSAERPPLAPGRPAPGRGPVAPAGGPIDPGAPPDFGDPEDFGGGDDFEDAATRVAGEFGNPAAPGPSAPAPPAGNAPAHPPPLPGVQRNETDSEHLDTDRWLASPPPAGWSQGAPGPAQTGQVGDDAATTVGPQWSEPEGRPSGRAFDRATFRAALAGLAPDGSAIDVPLGVFSDLPGDVLDQLVRGMALRTAAPGEILVREGEIGDACFVLASGQVRVLKREPSDPHSRPIEVARLGEGAVFGEFALLADRRRHATVEVVEAAELFEIPRRLASELAATHPEVRPALEKFYRERLLSTLLTTTPLFQPLPAERRADVLAHFHPRRSNSGEAIVREGEHAGGLYLIVLGQVEITKRVSAQRSVLLATLGEGAYFGEMSLLHGEPASASVTATGPTELAVLSAQAFYELLAEHPVLWEAMKRQAGERDVENDRIVTGNTSVV